MIAQYPASVAIARQSLRIMKADLGSLVALLAMPVVLMVIFKPLAQQALRGAGYHTATGAEQIVPALTVGFGLFLMGYIAFGFLAEHGWGTWERLRASRARPADIILGKLWPALGLAIAYEVILFVFGMAAFGLRFHGLVVGLVLTGVAFPACLVAIGIFLAAFCRTNQQVNVIINVAGILLGALGGAYVPLSQLPAWIRHVAPATPTYWAIKGFQTGILPGSGLARSLTCTGVLLAIAAAFGVAAASRFRVEETKPSF